MDYATLYQVRAYLGLADEETADDGKLTDFIRQANRWIDEYCGRRFDVYKETRYYDYPGGYDKLRLDTDLLSLVSLTNGDDTAIATTDVWLEPANSYPKCRIALKPSSSVTWQPDTNSDLSQIISVVGLWGYHTRYDSAWVNTLDTVWDNPLSAVATSLTFADADGAAGDGSLCRAQAGNLIKIEDEFLYISAVNYNTNVATVTRAYAGTTAAAHVLGTTIYVYRPMDNITAAAIRLAAWRYRQKDANVFDQTTILNTGVAIVPSAVPADVLQLLPSPRIDL